MPDFSDSRNWNEHEYFGIAADEHQAIRCGTTNHAVIEFYRRIDYATDDVVGLGKRLIPDAPEQS